MLVAILFASASIACSLFGVIPAMATDKSKAAMEFNAWAIELAVTGDNNDLTFGPRGPWEPAPWPEEAKNGGK